MVGDDGAFASEEGREAVPRPLGPSDAADAMPPGAGRPAEG
jgi:hypothetical protein